MLNILNKLINSDQIMAIQNCQYQEFLLLEDTVPAGSQKLSSVNVSSLGDFYCQYIVGHYTTLQNAQAITDYTTNFLRGKLLDGSNNRPLFNDFIPLDLFLSPGRIRSQQSTTPPTDAPSSTLFYPVRFEYVFAINSQIQFDCKNDSDVDNSYSICFYGFRFPFAQKKSFKRQ